MSRSDIALTKSSQRGRQRSSQKGRKQRAMPHDRAEVHLNDSCTETHPKTKPIPLPTPWISKLVQPAAAPGQSRSSRHCRQGALPALLPVSVRNWQRLWDERCPNQGTGHCQRSKSKLEAPRVFSKDLSRSGEVQQGRRPPMAAKTKER